MKSSASLRFVHAGNFDLGRTIAHLDAIPGRLRDTLLDAPWAAATNVFQTALEHEVDFVLLTGSLIEPGPLSVRAWQLLNRQFECLSRAGISVYCAQTTPPAPPAWSALPHGVHFLRPGSDASVSGHRNSTAARIVVSDGSGNWKIPPLSRPEMNGRTLTIAVSDDPDSTSFEMPNCADFVAVPSWKQAETRCIGRSVLCGSGSPQALGPGAQIPGGCWLVEPGAEGRLHTSRVQCDTVQWHSETVTIQNSRDAEALESTLVDRTDRILRAAGGRHVLIQWTIAGNVGVICRDVFSEKRQRIIDCLRDRFTRSSQIAWTINLEASWESEVFHPESASDALLREFLTLVNTIPLPTGTDIHAPALDEQKLRDDIARTGVEMLLSAGPAAA